MNDKLRVRRVHSGTPWESEVAYCRARRVGAWILISGTCAVDENGATVAPGQLFDQACYALAKIERALVELGATMADVVRTRTYVTDISQFAEFARAHRQYFLGIDPTATCVEVSHLIAPDLVVEIEVDAWLGQHEP
jgi:enamine deaminase RidA (YjgF/YER057c/UK114 family)